jgi:hypothetical protein
VREGEIAREKRRAVAGDDPTLVGKTGDSGKPVPRRGPCPNPRPALFSLSAPSSLSCVLLVHRTTGDFNHDASHGEQAPSPGESHCQAVAGRFDEFPTWKPTLTAGSSVQQPTWRGSRRAAGLRPLVTVLTGNWHAAFKLKAADVTERGTINSPRPWGLAKVGPWPCPPACQ